MNIIWIDGGLGNQMFQYALALKQQQMGKTVKIDVTKYETHHWHNDFELDRVFGLECPFADLKEIKKFGYRRDCQKDICFSRIRTGLAERAGTVNERNAFCECSYQKRRLFKLSESEWNLYIGLL